MRLEIIPGAGGEEAVDWAYMLFNMYLLYCEENNIEVKQLRKERKSGGCSIEPDWILELTGDTEKLKREHGIHRLVRISPFDNQARRHTSFAQVLINTETQINKTWGEQIRSYVLHPYKLIKTHATNQITEEVEKVLRGRLDLIWDAPEGKEDLP